MKEIVNTGGGTASETDWTLNATGPTPLSGTTPVDSDVDPGAYTLSESNGPTGYTASAWDCTGDGAQVGSQITLAAGESATCTITNTYIPPEPAHLTLVKEIDNTAAAPLRRRTGR